VVNIYGSNDSASLQDSLRFLALVTAKARRVLGI
jgi:hypothetical protein